MNNYPLPLVRLVVSTVLMHARLSRDNMRTADAPQEIKNALLIADNLIAATRPEPDHTK